MSKLSTKFITGISIILLMAGLCSIFFNTSFLEKYYLFQKKKSINLISENFSKTLKRGVPADEAIEQFEHSHKVIIVKIDYATNMNNDKVNDEIRKAFQYKGIGFQKYWLWEKDYADVLNGINRIRLYNQDKLNYSLLVEYLYTDSQLFAITMIIPNISDAFSIISTFLIFVNVMAIIISIIFIVLLIRKITKPLHDFKNFAYHMGNNEFRPLEIHTKDELESVAENLNSMGNQIITYQKSLQEKNRQMEQLLDDVAHDLKTPVSLIKLYADGIKDGLDDGTFLKTIAQQNDQMDQMINKLLFLSRIDKETVTTKNCNISAQLHELLDRYSILAKERNLEFVQNIADDILVTTNKEWMDSIFSNLLTNSIKYASTSKIHILLQKDLQHVIFIISNESNNQTLDLNKIWNPYYVGEKSRNKHLSGTGLGLSMVKKMTEKLNYEISCTFENLFITFTLRIPF